MRSLDAVGSHGFAMMRICPVNFIILDGFDLQFTAQSSMLDEGIAATYRAILDQVIRAALGINIANIEMAYGVADKLMVEWDEFSKYIMPSLQGCPVSIVKHAVIASTIEFCEKSLIWKQESIRNDVIAGQAVYAYAPPPNAKVVMPYKVTINDRELEPWDLASLEAFDRDWKLITMAQPNRYVQLWDDAIRLIGIPTETIRITDSAVYDNMYSSLSTTSGLMADVVLAPTRDAKFCPAFLYHDWAEIIAAGALYRLHKQVGKVWAKPELVQGYFKVYKEGISYAKSKADKSYQRKSNYMRPVQYFGGRAYYN